VEFVFLTFLPITCFINFRYVLQCFVYISVFKCLQHIRFVFDPICFVGVHVLIMLFVFIYACRCQTPFPYQAYVSRTIVTIGATRGTVIAYPSEIHTLFSGVHIVLSLILWCYIDRCFFVFLAFSLVHCLCPSNYGHWLILLYTHTHTQMEKN
jgi:hypothetical protein